MTASKEGKIDETNLVAFQNRETDEGWTGHRSEGESDPEGCGKTKRDELEPPRDLKTEDANSLFLSQSVPRSPPSFRPPAPIRSRS